MTSLLHWNSFLNFLKLWIFLQNSFKETLHNQTRAYIISAVERSLRLLCLCLSLSSCTNYDDIIWVSFSNNFFPVCLALLSAFYCVISNIMLAAILLFLSNNTQKYVVEIKYKIDRYSLYWFFIWGKVKPKVKCTWGKYGIVQKHCTFTQQPYCLFGDILTLNITNCFMNRW